jgi:hypothetical protein
VLYNLKCCCVMFGARDVACARPSAWVWVLPFKVSVLPGVPVCDDLAVRQRQVEATWRQCKVFERRLRARGSAWWYLMQQTKQIRIAHYDNQRSSMVPRSVRFGVRSKNVGWPLDGWPKIYYLELLCTSEGTLSRWSRLHLQSLTPTNTHWARVVS